MNYQISNTQLIFLHVPYCIDFIAKSEALYNWGIWHFNLELDDCW